MAFLDDLQRKDLHPHGSLLKPTASIALESYMFKRVITFIFASQGGWGHLITKTGPLMGYLNVILASLGRGEFELSFSEKFKCPSGCACAGFQSFSLINL